MTNEKARDLLSMIEVKEPNELIVNSWWGSFVKDYKEALQMAIKSLEAWESQYKEFNIEANKIKGRWKYQAQPRTSMISDMKVTCSVCGHIRSRYDGEILNYCPNCGADMRGNTDGNS